MKRALAGIVLLVACERGPAPVAPVYTPKQALATFRLPPGYSIQLVAAEPLVHDPVAIDFDADGRMYVVEMSGYMPSVSGEGEHIPNGKIVVLEDTNDDGRMDQRTVFLDSLVLPRTVSVLEHGVLVGAPPFLWLLRDTTGDLRADTRMVVRGDYGSTEANPEHNANGALWGIDNWLHSANDTRELRLNADGSFTARKTPSLGQWGVASDEYGRLYRNSNEDPLRTDHIPAHYAATFTAPEREPAALRGLYSALTANVPVFPSHKTPAVNRGYREKTLRADSTLAHYTSAGSPTPYVGDRYPAALRRGVFVTESAGNLVGLFMVADSNGTLRSARRAQDSVDFLTSTDERFRPVNLANAPDGTLYVVDMYRGIIQHRTYITDYLEGKIRERGLEQPVGFGRIYRIVYDSSGRGAPPKLSTQSSAQLVATLAHRSGWWRTVAQRLIVERRDTSALPQLRALLGHADDRVRLHALWTLDGLGVVTGGDVATALDDGSPHMRAAALRVAEPFLTRGDTAVHAGMMTLIADTAVVVRRQLTASLTQLAVADRIATATTLVDLGVSDGVSAELLARSANSRAFGLLTRILDRAPIRLNDSAIVEALAAQIARTADGATIAQSISRAFDARRPHALRVALIGGLARGAADANAPIELGTRPAALISMLQGSDSTLRVVARRLEPRMHWRGKPAPDVNAMRALTAAEIARIAAGRDDFGKTCAACHQANGAGLPGVAASLVGSAYVNGPPARLIRIVLHGKEGAMLMPPIGATMSDERLAAILSFIRREWGNRGDPIDAAAVKEVRGATTGRRRAWTVEELARVR